jgi:hypothetical protein
MHRARSDTPSERAADRSQVKRPEMRRRLPKALAAIFPPAAAALLATLPPAAAHAYTPDNHERSVREAFAACAADLPAPLPEADLEAIVRGAREPDDVSLALVQIGVQRIEPGARGKQRDVNVARIAEQSFHGSPNPTRPPYTDSLEDQRLKLRAIPVPQAELLPDRLELGVYAYDTNEAVRNKMLLNASQLLCVSLAHSDDRTSARKFGNLLHMVGDTYSASHVQRSAPEGSPAACGTEKIEWHFSMDLIVWKRHARADAEHGDWRFRCLVEHGAELMKRWASGRAAARAARDAAARRERANAAVEHVVDYLCDEVFREDPAVARRPAGGAAAEYSIASGSDNWARVFTFWRQQPPDRPIQPLGLTGPEEAQAFVARVNEGLAQQGRPPYFVYPSRAEGDYCDGFEREGSLPAALRCTPQEIEGAMSGSRELEGLLLPPRSRATLPAQ